VAIPNRAAVSWLLLSGGSLVEIYLGGERTGGVFLTLPTDDLTRLITELRTLRDADQPSDTTTRPSTARSSTVDIDHPPWTWPDPFTEADPCCGRPIRPPRPHDFAAGPNVCITTPPGATFVSRVSPDGKYGDLAIGTGTGVFLTLPRRGLDLLIAELGRITHGAINPGGCYPGSRWSAEPAQRSTNPTEPRITGPAD
jgi:hypothetical protein